MTARQERVLHRDRVEPFLVDGNWAAVVVKWTVAGAAICLPLDVQASLRVASGVNIIKLAWLGTRTDNDAPTVAFFRDVLGL